MNLESNCRDVWSEEDKDAERSRVMQVVNPALADLNDRLAAEREIASIAGEIGRAFQADHVLSKQSEGLSPHHIVVDLPRSPHPARITTIARNDDGRLDVPDVFYDPARWANVYSTQRRTGYVFAHPDRRSIVAIAAEIWFLRRFGCVLDEAARRQAKTFNLIEPNWFEALKQAGVISDRECSYLVKPRLVYIPLQLQKIHVPGSWIEANPTFVDDFNIAFSTILDEGISALAEQELVQTLRALFRTLQTLSEDATFVTSTLERESDLQRELRKALRQRDLDVTEGSTRAGGETDLTVGRRVVIENKILKEPTDDPFVAIPRAGLQGRRYVLPTNQRFVITAIAYRAKSEAGRLAPSQCVKVLPLNGVDQPFVEVRVAIRYGDTVPSQAKHPTKKGKSGKKA